MNVINLVLVSVCVVIVLLVCIFLRHWRSEDVREDPGGNSCCHQCERGGWWKVQTYCEFTLLVVKDHPTGCQGFRPITGCEIRPYPEPWEK